ncbi:MAG: tryptophan 2,3-dioxygenase family protein, partial [Pseudomonadota bacterium]
VQRQLYSQWAVLETLTPSDYAEMRGVLGSASGFQSLQYRKFEFLLGNRNPGFVRVHGKDTAAGQELADILNAPGLYDEFLRSLSRAGYAVPEERLERDWSQPVESHPALVAMFKTVYENTDEHWKVYAMCEKLVDIEQNFQIWRFRHVNAVERVIGFRRGTGGSSGVAFLKKALEVRFFPELFDVRTAIGI